MVVSPEMSSVLNSVLLSVASCSKYSPSAVCGGACRAGAVLAVACEAVRSDFVYRRCENTKKETLALPSAYFQGSSSKDIASPVLKDFEI